MKAASCGPYVRQLHFRDNEPVPAKLLRARDSIRWRTGDCHREILRPGPRGVRRTIQGYRENATLQGPRLLRFREVLGHVYPFLLDTGACFDGLFD